nr:zinc ribbon domain-containing protein [Desulfobacterales bacterium]
MPIYEYQCKTCGKVFEQFTWRMDKDADVTCPHCKNAGCQRVLSSCSAIGSKKSSSVGIGSSCGTASRGFS